MGCYPYLFFGGNCREAFTRYHQILGGRLDLVTGADMPAEDDVPAAMADVIMHAALVFDGGLLMASDDPTGPSWLMGRAVEATGPVGERSGFRVNVEMDSAAEAERVFRELSDGGTVQMPMEATSWSPAFGMCADRFGVPWMVSAAAPDGAADGAGASPATTA